MRVGDDEIGCEHGRSDFVAVGAVTDKAVDQPRPFGWLRVEAVSEQKKLVTSGGDEREGEGRRRGGCTQQISLADLRMPVAPRHRSMWPLLHLL